MTSARAAHARTATTAPVKKPNNFLLTFRNAGDQFVGGLASMLTDSLTKKADQGAALPVAATDLLSRRTTRIPA